MASATGGKVGNMRALFEAKQELSSSPPSRGRSPAGSDIHSIRSASSRPTSKIRSSFIVVEKAGTMGPILGLRRLSDVQDSPVIDTEGKESASRFGENIGKDSTVDKEEPAKNTADTQKPSMDISNKQLKQNSKEKEISTKEKDSAAMASTSAQRGETTTKHEASAIQTANKSVGGSLPKKLKSTAPKALSGKKKAEVTKVPASHPNSRSKSPVTTSSTKALSPTTSSTKLGTVSNPHAKQEPNPKPTSRISTPRTSLASTTTKDNKMTKPRPKSPTRPARLPAAAMASTASSAAKTSTADKPSTQSSEKHRVSTDNDFLTRMMRPTAASASKAHEKHVASALPPKPTPAKPKRTSVGIGKRSSDAGTKMASKPANSELGSAQDEQETKNVDEDLAGSEKPEDTEQAATSHESFDAEASGQTAKGDQSTDLVSHELDDQASNDTSNDITHVASAEHSLTNEKPVAQQSDDNVADSSKDNVETKEDLDPEANNDADRSNTVYNNSELAEESEDSQSSLVTLVRPQAKEDTSTRAVHAVELQHESSEPAEDTTNESIPETSNGSAGKTEQLDLHDEKDECVLPEKAEHSTTDAPSPSQALDDSENKAETPKDS